MCSRLETSSGIRDDHHDGVAGILLHGLPRVHQQYCTAVLKQYQQAVLSAQASPATAQQHCMLVFYNVSELGVARFADDDSGCREFRTELTRDCHRCFVDTFPCTEGLTFRGNEYAKVLKNVGTASVKKREQREQRTFCASTAMPVACDVVLQIQIYAHQHPQQPGTSSTLWW